MSDFSWTDNQKNAIFARGGSVLVSAAAGSGKTAVLVQRIIEAITDCDNPVSIDRMLIVTFTRAASSEMRTRIEQALDKLLRDDPYNKLLLTQKQLLYNAKISTIDGFCVDFIRQYFYKLYIQKDFRIADEGELKILRQKAVDNTLEYFYNNNDKGFIELVSRVCTYRNDDNLKAFILRTYDFLTSMPFAEDWIGSITALYDTRQNSFECTPYFEYIIDYTLECLEYCNSLITFAFYLVDRDEYLDDKQRAKLEDMLNSDKSFMESIRVYADSKDWDMLRDILSTLKFKTFPSLRDGGADVNKAIVKDLRDSYKADLKKLGELYFLSLEDINSESDRMYPIIKAFFNCVLKFRDEFFSLKKHKNILDFADIESLMVKLLCDNTDEGIKYTDISREISEMFDCIMVDEFQDINPVQDLIFRAVSSDENNLFFVGDVKQSIYGFRQAKPEIFINYKEKFSPFNKNTPEYPAKIILDKNFRSCKGITEACNFVFQNLMSPAVGGLYYTDEEKLVCGADYPQNDAPNLEVLIADSSLVDPEENETVLELEAVRVAEKINKLIFEEKLQIKDVTGERNVTYGDIAVLIRSPGGETRRAVNFANVLNRHLIPTVSDEKSSFFDANEIKIMLNVLRVIDNPLQDIPVLSAAMSPMFDFTVDDIAEIRGKFRKTPIYTAIQNSAGENEKAARFIDFIKKMRMISVTATVDRLISIIIQTTGFDSVVKALNGDNAGNLCLLQEYARAYGANGYKTITAFINYIDRIKDVGMDLKAGEEVGNGAVNAVRVMSIHAAKGLEFPVCFISCTSAKFNVRETSGDLILNSDYGIGLRYKDDYLKYDTVQRKTLSLMQKDALVSEEMRILYVAMTRAKERLIITCAQSNLLKYLSSLRMKISDGHITPYIVKNCSCFSDWILLCALINPNVKAPDEASIRVNDSQNTWNVEILPPGEQPEEENFAGEQQTAGEPGEALQTDREFLESFKKRIGFKYKNEPLQTLPQKVSASQLAHRDSGYFTKTLRKPDFLYRERAGGTEAGTAFHSFMENCSLTSARNDLVQEAQSLVQRGYLTGEQYDLLNFEKLENFIQSGLITRVLNSQEYFREYRFTVKIDASDYDPNIPKDFARRKIVMQGAVDLAFVENGELVIVDYKTDRVGDISKLGEMYSKQVQLYKNAMEQSTGLRVKETIIYSLSLNSQLTIK